MCAPRKALPLILLAGAAVATGGFGLAAGTTATTASTASTAATLGVDAVITGASVPATLTGTYTSSTLGTLSTGLKTALKYANTAAPFIGSAGLIYSGQLQKGIYEQQAAYSALQATQEEDNYILRRDQRRREFARALGKQRSLYGISGVALENTPTDIFASTARSFAEDDFYDRYGTANKIVSAGATADNLRASGSAAELGGLLNAELTLARRGVV